MAGFQFTPCGVLPLDVSVVPDAGLVPDGEPAEMSLAEKRLRRVWAQSFGWAPVAKQRGFFGRTFSRIFGRDR